MPKRVFDGAEVRPESTAESGPYWIEIWPGRNQAATVHSGQGIAFFARDLEAALELLKSKRANEHGIKYWAVPQSQEAELFQLLGIASGSPPQRSVARWRS